MEIQIISSHEIGHLLGLLHPDTPGNGNIFEEHGLEYSPDNLMVTGANNTRVGLIEWPQIVKISQVYNN